MPNLLLAGALALSLVQSSPCLDEALAAFDEARERTHELREAFSAARRFYLVALRKYSAGMSDLESAFEAERDLLAVEERLKVAEAEEMSALAALYRRIVTASCDDGVRRAPGKRERLTI